MAGLSYRIVSLVLAVLVAAVPGYCACGGHGTGAAANAVQQKKPACHKCESHQPRKQTSNSQDSEHCPTCRMTAEAKRADLRVQGAGAEIQLMPALLPEPVVMLASIFVPQMMNGGDIIIPHRLMDLVHSSCQLSN